MTETAGPVTYPPHLARRQPPKWPAVGACSGFGRSRSERVFRNEFPYLGRAGEAAWAGFRPVGGDRTGRLVVCSRCTGPAAAPAAAPHAKPKAAPKAAPAPAAQPRAAAGGRCAGSGRTRRRRSAPGQQVQLIYAPWTKFCLKGQDANAKQVCFTGKDGRIESGQPVIAAVIIEPEGEPKKILRVTLPLGMQLMHGTRVIVDNNPPVQSPYVICFANGCMSDYEVTPDLLANMKKGQNLVVQAINSNGAPLTLPLPLAEFAKAYDGPPTDPKVFEETQKKLQEELQKRAEEARKKLEATQSGAGAAPPTGCEIETSRVARMKRSAMRAPWRSADLAPALHPGYGAASSVQRRVARVDNRPICLLTKISATCECRIGSPESSGNRFCSDT